MKNNSKNTKELTNSKMPKQYNNMLALVIISAIVLFGVAMFLRTETGEKITGLSLRGMFSDAAPSKLKKSQKPIPDQYIVVFNSNIDESEVESISDELTAKVQGQKKHTYTKAIKGFSAKLPAAQVDKLLEDSRVAYVEEDGVTEPSEVQLNVPTWGLDRIDQQQLPLDTSYNYESNGSGVHAYIIDTGIRATHSDFGGRASVAYDAVGDGQNGFDCHGHGTHVAGTIGSTTYGVAKQVKLYGVRIAPCSGSGTISDMIEGIDWVTRNHLNPAVANISFGASGISTSWNSAITASVKAGVVYAVAAGNSNMDACNYSPSSTPTALTVGATTSIDSKASYSNYGKCVDIQAPGTSIASLSNADDTSIRYMSGTSMASPHVAGVAALYLQTHPTASPSEVMNSVVGSATKNILTGLDSDSPNSLLYNIVSYTGGDPTPPPPTEPPPTTGCTGTTYAGSVTDGGIAYHPVSGFSGRAGIYSGTMTKTNSGTAKLALERKQGKNWNQVATSNSVGETEIVQYSGSKGNYRWKVTGGTATTYSICSKIP
jgi:aqualysin 1